MRSNFLCTALLSIFLPLYSSHAQENGLPQPEAAAVAPVLSPVAAALSELKPISGSFNKDADYFIYLYSAGWCGPCRQVMPRIVRLYKETLSKDKRIEIILFDLDFSEDEAKKYVAHYDVDFFATMGRNPKVDQLPGAYQVRGIPHCIAVDKNGNKIFSGHAATIFHNLGLLR